MRKIYQLVFVVMFFLCSCECRPTLEIVNERNVPLTVYYNWNNSNSFGVAANSTESFNVGEEGGRTVRVSIFGSTLPIVEENINLSCKDTHTIVISPLEN
ncbi:MAG: hypothetical protein RIA69_11480 [Cyclobacteriaceae bacterium]